MFLYTFQFVSVILTQASPFFKAKLLYLLPSANSTWRKESKFLWKQINFESSFEIYVVAPQSTDKSQYDSSVLFTEKIKVCLSFMSFKPSSWARVWLVFVFLQNFVSWLLLLQFLHERERFPQFWDLWPYFPHKKHAPSNLVLFSLGKGAVGRPLIFFFFRVHYCLTFSFPRFFKISQGLFKILERQGCVFLRHHRGEGVVFIR